MSDDALVAMVKRSLEAPGHIETEEERKAREQKIRETPASARGSESCARTI